MNKGKRRRIKTKETMVIIQINNNYYKFKERYFIKMYVI